MKLKTNKKALSLILIIVLIFLAGCSAKSDNKTETTKPIKEPTGFVEMDIDSEYLQDARSICSKDDIVIFLTTVLLDENDKIVIPKDESDYEKYSSKNYIIEYNAKENKLIDKFEIKDCPISEIWGVELDNDNIVIFSNSEKKNAYYDFSMNFIKVTDRKATDEQEMAKKSDYYTERSSAYNGYCNFAGENGYHYLYFYDNPNELYEYKDDEEYAPMCLNNGNKLMLCENIADNSKALNYKVVDYKNSKEINKSSITAKNFGYDFASTNQFGLGNKYAIVTEYFGKNDSEDFTYKMLLWNYENERTNEALDIKKYTDLSSENTEKINNIKEKYGVDIRINETNEYIEESVICDENPKEIILLDNLNAISDFLDSLPSGMVKEIYSGFSNSENNKSGIRIDLVSKITIEAGAFAKSFVDPMEVCFPFDNITIANISHEFMHLFEERIIDYDQSFLEKWVEFNKGYEHSYNENEEMHPEYEFDEKHFLTEYSCTNNTEERAEIFSYLYTGGRDALKNEAIKEKADYLIKIINDSFPSVQKSNNIPWKIQ